MYLYRYMYLFFNSKMLLMLHFQHVLGTSKGFLMLRFQHVLRTSKTLLMLHFQHVLGTSKTLLVLRLQHVLRTSKPLLVLRLQHVLGTPKPVLMLRFQHVLGASNTLVMLRWHHVSSVSLFTSIDRPGGGIPEKLMSYVDVCWGFVWRNNLGNHANLTIMWLGTSRASKWKTTFERNGGWESQEQTNLQIPNEHVCAKTTAKPYCHFHTKHIFL